MSHNNDVIKVMKSRLTAGIITKTELSDELGISRVTLDTRISKNNWKKSELHLLNSILQVWLEC